MVPKPVFLLAGGRGNNKHMNSILRSVFNAAGKDSPKVAYVGVASGDNRIFFTFIKQMLKKGGAGKVDLASIARRNANIESAKEIINSADVIFMSGGDVEAGMKILEEKGLIIYFRELYQHGKLFFAASAGSIMLAKEWVRWRDPDDDTSAEIFPCLNLVPVLCDTHDEAGGWEELQALLKLEPDGTEGYGIASDSCLVVLPDGGLEAIDNPVFRFIKRGDRVERRADLIPE